MSNDERKWSLDPSLDHGVPDHMPVLTDCPNHGGNRQAAVDESGIIVCSDCHPNRPKLTAKDLR